MDPGAGTKGGLTKFIVTLVSCLKKRLLHYSGTVDTMVFHLVLLESNETVLEGHILTLDYPQESRYLRDRVPPRNPLPAGVRIQDGQLQGQDFKTRAVFIEDC